MYKMFIGITVALAALACGPAAQVPSREQGQAEQPKSGGVLTVSQAQDFFSYDPTYAGQSQPNMNATTLAYDRLVEFKAAPDVKFGEYILQPRLAERWELSPDARSFTFHLRRGVKYANQAPVNGREFTAADIKWTLEYHQRTGELAGKGLPRATSYTFTTDLLDRVDTPDPYTAVVRFREPFGPFITYAGTYNMVMLPREIFQEDGHLQDRLAGTGPFQLDMGSSQKGTRYVFKKHPGYFQHGKPYLDETRILVIKEESARIAAFQTKQLDIVIPQVSAGSAAFEQITKSVQGAQSHKTLDPAPYDLYISQKQGPTTNHLVRRAISLALDRDEFLKFFNAQEAGWMLAGARLEDWTQEEVKQILRQDVDEAKRLLAQAGYPNGVDLKLLNRDADSGGVKPEEQLLQAQLKRAGINVEIESVDKALGTKRLYSGQFDFILLYEKRFADVDSFFWDQNHSSSSGNWIGVKDSRLDRLVEAQRAAADPAERKKVLKEATRYINEMAYNLAVHPRMRYFVWQPYVKGYFPQDMQEDWMAKEVWLDK